MLLFDVNVLIYALRKDSERHNEALSIVHGAIDSPEELAWHSLIGSAMVRIVTNPRIYAYPSTHDECFTFVDTLLKASNIRRLDGGAGLWQTFETIVRTYKASGPAITDAYIAALAIANDATLISADRGFSRMKELRFREF